MSNKLPYYSRLANLSLLINIRKAHTRNLAIPFLLTSVSLFDFGPKRAAVE